MIAKSRQWVLAERPHGVVGPQHFLLQTREVGPLPADHIRVAVDKIGFEPAQRGWLNDLPSYIPPVARGAVMRSMGIGRVVESKLDEFPVGATVMGNLGWQEIADVTHDQHFPLTLIDATAKLPSSYFLHVLGLTGLTAYFGMLKVGRPVAGETVLVSSAAGATGSVAGQIAKARGCRVIGIAGGVEKCRLLTEHYGFDSAIDYKNSDVAAQLTELAPQGVDVYFDNVGLPILDQVLAKIRIGARVVLCGGISSGYTGDRPSLGVTNYMQLVIRRATMQGFLVLDYVDEYATARTELASMLGDASLVVHEDCLHGIESCPEALAGLFAGANVGKQLVLLDHGEVE